MPARTILTAIGLTLAAQPIAAQTAPQSLLDRLAEPLRAVPHRDGTARVAPLDPGVAVQVAAMVRSQFADFDRDGDDRLDRVEFGRWMATLRADDSARGQIDSGWRDTAFADADADHDGGVDRGELTAFLTRTASWRLPPGGVRAGPAP